MAGLQITHFSDPGCPWAWSASPHLAVLQWRYGDQLTWRHVMIGLAEEGSVYERRGYSGGQQAKGYRYFRDRGMPFATAPRDHVHGTWPMCRVVVAARRLQPDREWAVFRALQFAQFTTTLDMQEPDSLVEALAWLPDVDAQALVDASTDPETERRFEQDRDEARSAAGGATEFQGKSANYDGRVRYTAPSLLLTNEEGQTLEAGGFQSTEVYDVCVANLDRSLTRREPAAHASEVLPEFAAGLTTAEVAAVMAPSNTAPDLQEAEDSLIEAAADGAVRRLPFGHDALWLPATATTTAPHQKELQSATA